jgi:hypothetical protein
MKKYLLGIVAVLLAIGFSAFSNAGKNTKPVSGEQWFVFDGTDPGDLGNPAMYSLDGNGSTPTVCPTDVTSAYRCEILAQPTGSPAVPVLSTKIGERKRTTP